MSCCELIVGNTTDIKLTGYHRQTSGAWVNNASPVAAVKDSSGSAVDGGESISLAYVGGSNGDYLGTLPADAAIVVGQVYTIEVVDATNGFSDRITVVAKDRSGC